MQDFCELMAAVAIIGFIGFIAVGIFGAVICFWVDLISAIVR